MSKKVSFDDTKNNIINIKSIDYYTESDIRISSVELHKDVRELHRVCNDTLGSYIVKKISKINLKMEEMIKSIDVDKMSNIRILQIIYDLQLIIKKYEFYDLSYLTQNIFNLYNCIRKLKMFFHKNKIHKKYENLTYINVFIILKEYECVHFINLIKIDYENIVVPLEKIFHKIFELFYKFNCIIDTDNLDEKIDTSDLINIFFIYKIDDMISIIKIIEYNNMYISTLLKYYDLNDKIICLYNKFNNITNVSDEFYKLLELSEE